jgi:hypothetical protein
MKRVTALAALVLAWAIALPRSAESQIRSSERASVGQTVDGTTFTIEYARPGARGRELFGGVVHWGEMWTPGANWATTFEVDKDIRLNGHEVAAGTYSVWMEPQPETWTVHLHENPKLFHTQRPKHADFVLSFEVEPMNGPAVEFLTFLVTDVRKDGAAVQLQWGTTVIPLDIHVRPTLRIVELDDDEMAPYIGAYRMTMNSEQGTREVEIEILGDDGRLRGKWAGADDFGFELLTTGTAHRFGLAFLRNGEIADIEEVAWTFDVDADGQATGFTVPGIGDEIWLSGVRK